MGFLLKHRIQVYSTISVVAALLFIASLSVHTLTIFEINIGEIIPNIWLVHIIILALIVPLGILLRAEDNAKAEGNNNRQEKSFPTWLGVAYCLLGIYVAANFLIFSWGAEGQPDIQNNKYVLHNHGHVIRELDKKEYDIAKAQTLRGASGHWLIFSFAAATIGYFMSRKDSDSENT